MFGRKTPGGSSLRLDRRWHAWMLMLILLVPVDLSRATQTRATQAPARLGQLGSELADIAERVSPAVVQVFATGYRAGMPGGDTVITRERSSGSGALVSSDGYVLTNAHVVSNARRVQVLLPPAADTVRAEPGSILRPPGSAVDARVVGTDAETDLAVLKIDRENLPFLEFGDSDALRPGHLVLAFGFPLALGNSVTMGVISSVARQLEPDHPMIYIQTDAPINPGNSGGPLVDTLGRVVGINTFILSRSGGSEGIGFAAPSNIARHVFQEIRSRGRVRRSHIGIHVQTITPALATGLSLPQNWGVVVSDVTPGGPGYVAGLQIGDVVLKLDGKVMENGRQFDVNLYRRAPGETVVLEIQRDTRPISVRVRAVEREEELDRFAAMVTPERNSVPELEILGIDIDAEIARLLPPPRKAGGVLVVTLSGGAPLQDRSLRPGDILHSVNGKPVFSLQDLRKLLDPLQSGDTIVLQVNRAGTLTFIPMQLP